jgi:CheY-like chemotaxis protein
VTAYARPRDREGSLRAGFQSHLPKPFTAGELVDIIRDLAHVKDPAYERTQGR